VPSKTKRDEEKWEKAKTLAEEQGHKEDYAYIMGIYKKMKPDYEFKNKEATMNDLKQAAADYEASLKLGADPHKNVAAKAEDLCKLCEKIAKDAKDGNGAAIDNHARKTRMLEAKCNLLVKALKNAEGEGSGTRS